MKNLKCEIEEQVWYKIRHKFMDRLLDLVDIEIFDHGSNQIWAQIQDRVADQVYRKVWDKVQHQLR